MIARPITRPITRPVARAITDIGYSLERQIADLFASGEQGAWYDIAPQYCYQDTAGTTPAAIGDPVGRLTDRSGRGNHALQATATARPILRQNAVTGAHYLEFDGADDWMSVAGLNPSGPLLICAGVMSTVSAGGNSGWIVGNRSTVNAQAAGWQLSGAKFIVADGVLFEEALGSSLAAGSNKLICGVHLPDATTLRSNGAIVASAVNQPLGVTTGPYTTSSIGALDHGASRFHFLNGHLYGLIVRGAASNDSQIKLVERYLAQKTGVTLA